MYIKELTISETDQTKPVGDVKDIAASMTSLTAISVKSGDEDSNMNYTQLFENLPKENINKKNTRIFCYETSHQELRTIPDNIRNPRCCNN